MLSLLDKDNLLIVQTDSQLVIVIKLFFLGIDYDCLELKLVEKGAYPLLVLRYKGDG